MKNVRVQINLEDHSVLRDLSFDFIPLVGDNLRLKEDFCANVTDRIFTISGEIFLFADYFGAQEDSDELAKHLLANGWASNPDHLRFT